VRKGAKWPRTAVSFEGRRECTERIPADVRRLIREMSIANPAAEPQGWPLFADSTEEKDPLANGTTIAGRCRAPPPTLDIRAAKAALLRASGCRGAAADDRNPQEQIVRQDRQLHRRAFSLALMFRRWRSPPGRCRVGLRLPLSHRRDRSIVEDKLYRCLVEARLAGLRGLGLGDPRCLDLARHLLRCGPARPLASLRHVGGRWRPDCLAGHIRFELANPGAPECRAYFSASDTRRQGCPHPVIKRVTANLRRRGICLAGHIRFELANPGSNQLIGFA
jgi:hypothetical protein